MARRRDPAARGGPAARRRSAVRIVGFWLVFLIAGWGALRLVDRLVMVSSEAIAGGRADVADLPGRWSDGRTTIRIRGQGGRLALSVERDGSGSVAGRDAFLLDPRRAGLFSRSPVFVTQGDPTIHLSLVGARLMLDAKGMRGGLPAHAELRRIDNDRTAG